MAANAAAPTPSSVDAHLEMEPEDAIVFPLSLVATPSAADGSASTPRVTLTLRHPDRDSPPIAFKVRPPEK
jgi:hypothetical protein